MLNAVKSVAYVCVNFLCLSDFSHTIARYKKAHISLYTLRLCIKRNNLGVPIELWNIICSHIRNDIELFRPYKYYILYCGEEEKNIYIESKKQPKKCPNDESSVCLLRCSSTPYDFDCRYKDIIKI